MPIYEYRCDQCDHTFEVIQKVSDEPIRKCVVCGGIVRKVLSAPGLIFKGTGWYVTDYASGERKKAMEAEKSGGDGKESKDGKDGKDAKPEAKTTTTTPSTPAKEPTS